MIDMGATTDLIKELAKDIERYPESWTRYQSWLSKKFDSHGRIGVRIFTYGNFYLELDASEQRKGNLDKLTLRQRWILWKVSRKWLAWRHGGIYAAMADWHKDPDLPMKDWIQRREAELNNKRGTSDNTSKD